MIPQQYADDLVAKSCKVAYIYDEGTMNDVYIEDVNASIAIDSVTIGCRTHKQI